MSQKLNQAYVTLKLILHEIMCINWVFGYCMLRETNLRPDPPVTTLRLSPTAYEYNTKLGTLILAKHSEYRMLQRLAPFCGLTMSPNFIPGFERDKPVIISGHFLLSSTLAPPLYLSHSMCVCVCVYMCALVFLTTFFLVSVSPLFSFIISSVIVRNKL